MIIKHMWPVTTQLPNSLEGLILTFVDKYCAMSEGVEILRTRLLLIKPLRYLYSFLSLVSIHI